MPTRPRAPFRLGVFRSGVFAAAALVLTLGAPTVLAADREVDIRDFAFAPGSVEIRVGDAVTWTNRDSVAHTATAQNGSFDTGSLEEGESGSIRFTVAGTYRYLCTPHPDMTGTVVVRPASRGSGRRPPNTDTAAASATDTGASDRSPLAMLAALGGITFVWACRAIGRRHGTG